MWTCLIPEDDITVVSTSNTHDIMYIGCQRLPSDVNLHHLPQNIQNHLRHIYLCYLSSGFCNINLLLQGALYKTLS